MGNEANSILKTTALFLFLILSILAISYSVFIVYGVLSGGEVAKLDGGEKISIVIAVFSAFGTIFAAYAALSANRLAAYEAKTNATHRLLSVKPNLFVRARADNIKGSFEFTLRNEGLGPAIVESIKIEIPSFEDPSKKEVFLSSKDNHPFVDFAKYILGNAAVQSRFREKSSTLFSVRIDYEPLSSGSSISSQGTVVGVTIFSEPETPELAEFLSAEISGINVEIVYNSIYNEVKSYVFKDTFYSTMGTLITK